MKEKNNAKSPRKKQASAKKLRYINLKGVLKKGKVWGVGGGARQLTV